MTEVITIMVGLISLSKILKLKGCYQDIGDLTFNFLQQTPITHLVSFILGFHH